MSNLIENLESRRLLSASPTGLAHGKALVKPVTKGPPPAVVVKGSNVQVRGTSGRDVVLISQTAPQTLSVVFNGGTPITVNLTSKVKKVMVRLGAGNDEATIADSVPTTLRTLINGGTGNDVLTGGLGRDILIGGDGVDTLNGRAGNDILDGGDGVDKVTGGSGDDTFSADDSAGEILDMNKNGPNEKDRVGDDDLAEELEQQMENT